MKITEALKVELALWLDTFWKTYLCGDLETWATFIKEDYYNIGGTKEEIWHSKQEILDYTRAIADQMVNQAEFRNRKIEVLPYGDYLMVNEFTDLFVKIEEEWTFYGPFRMSSLISKTETGWIALHQHGSYPDMKATKGEAFAADALKAENKRLQEAVDQRTVELQGKNQELEIEASLERVRTVAMGMKTPDDMLQVCRTIASQLEVLGVKQIRNLQTAIIESKEDIYLCYQYFPSYDRDVIERTEYLKSPVEQQMVDQMLATRDSHFLGSMSGEELADFRAHRKREKHLDDPLLDKSEELGYCFLSIGEGGLGLTLYSTLDEKSLALFKRFHQVFSLAYQRFRDIQKAEAQAREAEIELALERVRSRSLAMHATSELQEVIHAVHQELIKLDIGIFGGSFIAINSEIEEELHCWGAGGTADTSDEVHIPYFDKPFYTNLVKGLKGGPSFFTEEFTQEEKKEFFTFLFTKEPWSNLKPNEKKEILSSPGGYTRSCSVSLHTSIFIINQLGNKFSEKENDILIRFGKVFEQSYTRFLDLQKAETQAREAQIEAAIERVRAQSMAMHHPDDLDKVNKEILSQLNWLQIQGLTGVTFYLIDEKGWVKAWDFSSPGNTADQSSYTLQFDSNKHEMLGFPFKTLRQTDLDYFVADYPLEKLEKAVYEFEEIDPAMAKVVREALSTGILTHQWTACCRISNGLLGIDLVIPPNEDTKAIVLKMAGAFNQAYTRFLDLQKAEAQAREAEIELALERVRARTMAMHSSSELLEVATVLFQQVKALGVPQWNCGFNIWEKGDTEFTYYPGSPDGIIFPSPCKIPLEEHPIFRKFNESRNRGEELLIYEKEGEIQADHYAYMLSLPGVGDLLQSMLDAGFELPTFQIDHIANFAYGNLIFITYQHYPEMHEVFKRFAKVFEQTYTRFLDLQRAEAQAREAQIEAALERIRSRSLAMYKTDDLREVVAVLFEQMQGLSVDMGFASVSIFIFEQDSRNITQWIPTSVGVSTLSIPYFDHPISADLFDAKENGADYFAKIYTLEEKNSWLEAGFELTDYKDLPDDFKASLIEAPGYAISITLAKSSGICIPSFVGTLPSSDDVAIMKRVGKVFEQAYIRFLDLQRAEAQAKEAQIEAALERIRGQVASMRESTELLEIVVTMRNEFVALGHEAHYFWHMRWLPDSYEKAMTSGDGTQIGMVMSLPRRIHGDIKMVADWEKGSESILVLAMETEIAVDYVEKMINWGDFERVDPQAPTLDDIRHIEGLTFVMARTSHGEIGFSLPGSVLNPPQEAMDTLVRFAKVFDLAYKRFEDLKKAEHQTRETQIELALERVRSRSMAMQRSEELQEVIQVVYRQFVGLEIPIEHTGFIMDYKDREDMNIWLADSNQLHSEITFPYFDSPHWNSYLEAKAKGENFFANLLDFETKNRFYQDLFALIPDLPKETQDFYFSQEGLSISTVLLDNVGLYIENYTTTPFTDEENQVLLRFGKVFQQTYTRFLDLQKAETQAREAQIELSLERIRAQVTAMRQSDELFDIVVLMRKEFISLGHEADYFWHMKWTPENYDMSMTSEDGERVGMIISVPKFVHDEIPRLAEWEKSDSPIIALDLNGPEAWDYIDKMNTYGKYEQADPHAPSEEDIMAIGGLTFVIARTTHGEIGFSLAGQVPNPPQESTETLIRFAGVFDLAYRRFEDLLTAEKQNRKAKIELALERIRSRAMAMYSTSELKEVIKTVDDQIKELGVDNSGGAFIVINKDLKDGFSCWGSGGVGNYIRKVDIPFLNKPIYGALKEGIEKRVAFFTEQYTVDEKREFFNLLFSNPPFDVTPMERQEVLLSSTEGYARSCTVSDHTSIFIINHEGKAFQEEENEILRQIGRAFEQAYRRFLDLEKAENQARLIREERDRLEITLQELKAAQEQLIQQEKLASLGQLTAGIAHEIKNPLNFVNNFSDLSRELIEEVFAELENLEASATKEEIIAILQDVQGNLTKVHEHGTRADSIVTSMLQHSRASGSKREAKAFNPLVKEFVNLSFHGMRAGKAPINVDIDVQLDPKVGEVTLISEDFSRVILNLCNNAFDAMRDKFLKTGAGSRETEDGNSYLPKLTVKTSLQKDKVMLSIGDNGGGIPEEIKDKILQPFFTTKKGTEGTGLGLSITNDIIKAHGGELRVESKEGEGSEFVIYLTLNN